MKKNIFLLLIFTCLVNISLAQNNTSYYFISVSGYGDGSPEPAMYFSKIWKCQTYDTRKKTEYHNYIVDEFCKYLTLNTDFAGTYDCSISNFWWDGFLSKSEAMQFRQQKINAAKYNNGRAFETGFYLMDCKEGLFGYNKQSSNSASNDDYNQEFKKATSTNRATSPVMNSDNQKYSLAEHQNRMKQIQYDIDKQMVSKRAKINAISNAVTGLSNYFYQRAQQKKEWQRQQQLRQQAEEDRKSAFYQQAQLYRSEYKKFINGRKALIQETNLKSLLDKDGTTFKPVFLYYAYTKKGYDYYSENVDYNSNALDFKINEQATINFSPIFGIFPQINGEYPLISSLKSIILNDHFKGNINEFDIVFFSWQTSVDDILANYQKDINRSVNQNYFSEAIPSIKNEIIFLNTNVSSSSKDYWTGEKVKQKNTKKKDYWNQKKETIKKDSTKAKKKKIDYWNNN